MRTRLAPTLSPLRAVGRGSLPAGAFAVAVLGLLSLGDGAALAEADADVGIDATVTLRFDERGRFVAVRQKWTFDFAYSGTAGKLMDADANGTLDQAELENAPENVLSWMRRFGYFTRISEGDEPIAPGEATDVVVAFDAGRLVVDFTLPLVAPPRLAVQSIAVSDPDLFYVIRYGVPDVVTDGAPDYCSVVRQSPTGSEIDVRVTCR
jgi:ABC-type uncharacterized transport system substrate-binding protein